MIFKLDVYYNFTRRKYVFVDYLMDINEVKNKEELLLKFDIWYNTFRVEKSRERVKNNKIERVLTYYNVEPLLIGSKYKYEKCINELYYAIYFKEIDRIKACINVVNECIEDNNYLKPLFTMFRIYAHMNIGNDINEIYEMVSDDLKYIMKFKKNYFINEYEIIFESIKHGLYKVDNLLKLNRLANEYKSLKWIYLSAAGTTYYFKEEDEKVISIYEELVEDFTFHNNTERLMIAYSNICYSYNKLRRFSKCIEVTEKCLPIIYSGRKSVWIDNVLLHYIYANYAIEKYDTIVNMFTTPIFNSDRFFWVTAFICILAANKINQINRAQFIIDKFKDDANINLLLRYINEKNIKILYDVKMLSYIPDIIQKLKHR